jgi:AcrR family transcriptional regulator
LVHLVNVRADAVRNRTRILDAARELVAVQGPEVSMEAIAGLAGVAVGTLYRHHPTKAALLRAVVAHSAEHIAAAAETALARVRSGADAGEEFNTLLRALADRLALDLAVKAAAASLGEQLGEQLPSDPDGYDAGSAEGRALAAIAALLDAAQRAGAVRGDVTLPDLVVFLTALPGATVPAEQRERFVDVVLAGLRAR